MKEKIESIIGFAVICCIGYAVYGVYSFFFSSDLSDDYPEIVEYLQCATAAEMLASSEEEIIKVGKKAKAKLVPLIRESGIDSQEFLEINKEIRKELSQDRKKILEIHNSVTCRALRS
ncbi:hypothetical protein QV06_07570 [Gallibacterium genomosp. 3]|uniref:Uncharacterized protein n=1 Tax=Gallibacterium genomosp. 3 TaxID=505345 RepID=A0A1A7PR36_9PAST|nr:hypothetical protein [Gallibacterium genomosp. 3]OBX04211.1 hypothetical protein QV06_07570 [Gallibacterium genomosp. 3]